MQEIPYGAAGLHTRIAVHLPGLITLLKCDPLQDMDHQL